MTQWASLIEESGTCKWIPPRTKAAVRVRDAEGAKVRLFRASADATGVQLINPTGSAAIPYQKLTKAELKALGLACIRMAMEMKDE